MVATKAVDADIVAALRYKLVQPGTSLSQKYRVLFSLRNIPGTDSGEAIIEGTSLRAVRLPSWQLKLLQLVCRPQGRLGLVQARSSILLGPKAGCSCNRNPQSSASRHH